jgi:hypothetical protein
VYSVLPLLSKQTLSSGWNLSHDTDDDEGVPLTVKPSVNFALLLALVAKAPAMANTKADAPTVNFFVFMIEALL